MNNPKDIGNQSYVRQRWNKGDVLAFVHIEKAAGTTFIHILRHNFLLKYLDVRPYYSDSRGIFRIADYHIARKVVPGLRCIGGHSVTPASGLHYHDPRIKYITILRDPIRRYVSQYQYWLDRLGKKLSFEEFLSLEETWNFQTKKLAGNEDLATAIKVLDSEILLLGFVERYDEFLILLRQKLLPESFDPRYKKVNEGRRSVLVDKLINDYRKQIESVNELDIELYRYATEKVYPRQVAMFSGDIDEEVKEFREWNSRVGPVMWPRYIDYGMRKIYLEPVTGIIRLMNGLPYKGSY